MPWCAGCRPVRMVACDGTVSGTWLTAAVNRVASRAKASSDGVTSRVDPYDPSRSALSVSIVISTIGGRAPRGLPTAEVRPFEHAAHARTRYEKSATARIAVSVQLRSGRLRQCPAAAGRDQDPYASPYRVVRNHAHA